MAKGKKRCPGGDDCVCDCRERLVTQAEIARVCNVSRWTLNRWIEEGRFNLPEPIKIGRSVRWAVSDVWRAIVALRKERDQKAAAKAEKATRPPKKPGPPRGFQPRHLPRGRGLKGTKPNPAFYQLTGEPMPKRPRPRLRFTY